MGWTDSRVFTAAVLNPMTQAIAGSSNITLPTTYSTTGGLLSDAVKAALFNTSVTPDRTAAVGSTGYNTGTWLTANELTSSSQWPAGGVALATKAYANVGGTVCSFTAANTAGSGNVTISGAFGCLVYDSTISGGTVASQGMCYNYFGGTQSVTAGTFTIVWDATGVFKFTT